MSAPLPIGCASWRSRAPESATLPKLGFFLHFLAVTAHCSHLSSTMLGRRDRRIPLEEDHVSLKTKRLKCVFAVAKIRCGKEKCDHLCTVTAQTVPATCTPSFHCPLLAPLAAPFAFLFRNCLQDNERMSTKLDGVCRSDASLFPCRPRLATSRMHMSPDMLLLFFLCFFVQNKEEGANVVPIYTCAPPHC